MHQNIQTRRNVENKMRRKAGQLNELGRQRRDRDSRLLYSHSLPRVRGHDNDDTGSASPELLCTVMAKATGQNTDGNPFR